jgi:chromatin remodeling complex protein RSC6
MASKKVMKFLKNGFKKVSSHLQILSSLSKFEISRNFSMLKGRGLTKPMELSAQLSEIVGKKEASRAEYIK